MAGEGSMLHAIHTLKENRRLLRKKSFFRRDIGMARLKDEYLKNATGDLKFVDLTKEQLQEIRIKVIKQQRKLLVLQWVAVFSVVMAVSFFTYKYVINHEVLVERNIEYTQDEIKMYHFYLESGENWIKQKSWDNAIFEYSHLLETFPNDVEANYLLAFSYVSKCTQDLQGCEKASEIVDAMLLKFPEDNKYKKLRKLLDTY